MKAVECNDLESLVRLNSILIFNIDCWGASYLRNILSHGPSHITTKQGNKTLPTELWLEILNLAEVRINKDTYKLVYGIEITEESTNGSAIEPTLICNVLEEWKECGELESGDHVGVYEKCLKDPSYEIDPEKDRVEEDIEPFFRINKTAVENAYWIPVSHLRFQGDFLFHNIEVPNIIARLENGVCNLCMDSRSWTYICMMHEKMPASSVGKYYRMEIAAMTLSAHCAWEKNMRMSIFMSCTGNARIGIAMKRRRRRKRRRRTPRKRRWQRRGSESGYKSDTRS